MKDRVLGKFGFEPFPERLEEKAIAQGSKAAPADTGIDEPLINHTAHAKRELALKLNEEAKAQAEMDKIIKERELKKALGEKDLDDLLIKDAAAKVDGEIIKAVSELAKARSEKKA